MILEIPDFLSRDEVGRLQQFASEASFVNGRITNPHNKAKNNEQVEVGSPAHQQSSQLIVDALIRDEQFRAYGTPSVAFLLHPHVSGRTQEYADSAVFHCSAVERNVPREQPGGRYAHRYQRKLAP